MAFLSSKLLQQIETVFQMIQVPELVKTAEEELSRMRTFPQYQLLLVTFLTRSKNHHHRILAALEIEKRVLIQEPQTVSLLKECYMQDLDKIAGIIRRVLIHPDNSQWTSSLLTYNFEVMGTMESVRLIQLLFSWLQDPQQGIRLVRHHFELFLTCFSSLVETVLESQDCLFMSLVTLGMFYRNVVDSQKYIPEQIKSQATWIFEKCRFYSNPLISLLICWIGSFILNFQSSPEFQDSLAQLITPLLTLKLDQTKLKYQSKCLQLLVLSGTVFSDPRTLIQFINTFNIYSNNLNSLKLEESSYSWVTQLSNSLDSEDKYQLIVRSCLSHLIEELFQVHYQQIAKCFEEKAEKSLFMLFMPLVTYYGSTRSPVIEQWIGDHIEQAVHQLGLILDRVHMSGQDQDLINDWVTCLLFLICFKHLIPIHLLPHIGSLLSKMSLCSSRLSALSFQFLEEVSPEITNLDFNDISDFLLEHLQKLNSNEWDHCLYYYSCFLSLALHLEHRYQFFSHLLLHDSLVIESLKAQTILVNLLEDTPQAKMELDIVNKLITFTNYIFLGMNPMNLRDFHQKLRVSLLADLLQRHQLYYEENVFVVIWEWIITGRMVVNLQWIADQDESQDADLLFRESIRREMENCRELQAKVNNF